MSAQSIHDLKEKINNLKMIISYNKLNERNYVESGKLSYDNSRLQMLEQQLNSNIGKELLKG